MILPPRCIVSGDIVGKQGMVAPAVWAGLSFIGTPQCTCCGYPFEFVTEGEMLCGGCLRELPPFAAARAALAYDDGSRDMILKFKHADHTHAVHTFLPWMERAGQGFLARADLFVPVPLHRWRLLRRRYNQAGLIAALLARRAQRRFVPDGLIRSRATQSQGHLRFRERHKNVKRAFSVHPKRVEILRGKSIVLVDDVYTTGATVKECTKALLAAGAAEVNVLTVTRVLRPDGAN